MAVQSRCSAVLVVSCKPTHSIVCAACGYMVCAVPCMAVCCLARVAILIN